MRMNFFPALRATRAAVTRMMTQGGGAIVNIVDVTGANFVIDGGLIKTI